MDDPELLRAYVEDGSEPAFTALVERYTQLVYSAALRQVGGNTHLARDVVQGVFTDLARKAAQLRGRKVLTGWLYTSTHFAVAEIHRAERRRKTREQEAQIMMQISAADTPDTWSRLHPVLDEAMRELGDDDRDSILLRYFEGRPFAEIGEKLALSENAARMRTERALDKMHALLAKRGLTSSAAALATVLTEQAVVAAPPGLVADVAATAFAQAARAKPLVFLLGQTKAQVATFAAVIVVCAGILTVFNQTNAHLRDDLGQRQRQNRAATLAMREDSQQLERRAADLASHRRLVTAALRLSTAGAASGHAPADRRAMLRTRTTVALRYASLFRSFKLPPEQQEQFAGLLLQKSLAEIAVLNALAFGSMGSAAPNDPELIGALKSTVTADLDARVRALLGDDLFQRYDEYARTLPVRRQVEEIAAAQNSTEAALRDEEIDGLVAVVARASSDYSRPLAAAELEAARAGLDAQQQAALDRLQAIRAARGTILEANREAATKGLVQLPRLSGSDLDAL